MDDEVALTDALSVGLGHEGFDVDVANEGNDGLWRAREFSYDAIVLDVLLPGVNGFRICETLRAENVTTPVLMLTVKSGEFDEAGALDLGADDYITKPFSFPVLVARLHALLRRSRTDSSPILETGDLQVDSRRRQCSRSGQEVPLTPREFALLEALARRPGLTVSREELLELVWGWEFAGNPAVLDVYIGYLRDKIDRPFGRASIQTIRGVGYRLVDDG